MINRASARASKIEAFIRFEEAMMDLLFMNGRLSAGMRPLWKERLAARKRVPGADALKTHREAARDCLEMAREWTSEEVDIADRFFVRHGAPTIAEVRALLASKPRKRQHRPKNLAP